nr:NAD(P)H-hydrate epimerase [Acidimicrobiia bacterium]
MIPIVTPAEMAAVDAAAADSLDVLVERAGSAVARAARQMLGGTYGRTVRVIAGKGNNGADGRAAAAWLERRGVKVDVIDAARCPPTLAPADLVIDAAFGTGFRDTWRAPRVGATPVLAVDIP